MADKTCNNCSERINTSRHKIFKPKGFWGFLKKENFCSAFCRDEYAKKKK